MSSLHKLDDRERATVLAALRYWQAYGLRAPIQGQRMTMIREIADNGGEVEALSENEIDDLCERLNAGPVGKVPFTVWTVTTDGDNCPIETALFLTEDDARAAVEAGLETHGVRRCKDGQRLSSASLAELSELWEEAADGVCIIEEHRVEAPVAPSPAPDAPSLAMPEKDKVSHA